VDGRVPGAAGVETDPVPASTTLPEWPQLLPGTPVLRRAPEEVQVGLEPGRAVRLRGPAPQLLVAGLDGRTPLPDLHACGAAAGLTAGEVDGVLDALLQAGLLTGAVGGASPAPALRLAGLDRMGQQVAALLVGAGFNLYAADLHGHGAPPHLGLTGGPTAAGPTAAGRITLVNHWSKPDRHLVLTVVAVDAPEVDRLVTDHLLRTDQPHLLLRSTGSTVTVGPLVVPGHTACLRCTDLGRRDRDPAWPQLLPQLVRLRRPPSPLLTAWAGSVGAAQAHAFLAGELPESAGATLELSSADHLMRWRAWPRHAACGCSWSGTTQWAP
jgi:hypothetical protein